MQRSKKMRCAISNRPMSARGSQTDLPPSFKPGLLHPPKADARKQALPRPLGAAITGLVDHYARVPCALIPIEAESSRTLTSLSE
jgi:hypothetical protein